MKKVCLIILLTVFSFSSVDAQGNIEARAKVGFVIGDASDFTSSNVGVAVAYLFDVSEDVKVGPSVGFDNWFAKEEAENLQTLAIMAKMVYRLSGRVNAEAGAGYAVFTGDGGGGEFTYRIGGEYKFVSDAEWYGLAGFESITGNGGSIDALYVGVGFKF